jgi:hypothetical protein
MLSMKKVLLGVAALAGLVLSGPVQAETFSDTGAAVLIWPTIIVTDDYDTIVTMTNQASVPSAAHCFYVNANNRCSNTGEVCEDSSECEDGGFFGACLPGWIEINFDVLLTRDQPLGWSAAEGLSGSALPCPGGIGSPCAGNGGTRVPPVGEVPFVGELKCIQSDPITRLPAPCSDESPSTRCRNDLEGGATITGFNPVNGEIDPERYNAVGLRSAGQNDGNSLLVIGGPPLQAEYQPCSEVLVFNHMFDGAVDPINPDNEFASTLSLVPCTENFLTQAVPRVNAQFLVYNEFEQRFSTSRLVECLLTSDISNIDTTQSNRSIFSAAVAGTVAGQTRITGVGGGLIGAATLFTFNDELEAISGAGYNLNQFADRVDPDFISIP